MGKAAKAPEAAKVQAKIPAPTKGTPPPSAAGSGAGRVIGVLLAVLVGLVAFLVQSLLPSVPRSRVCGPSQPDACILDGVQERYKRAQSISGDLKALHVATAGRFADAKKQGRSPTILYLGPYDSAPEFAPGGILDFRKHLTQWSPRMFFVDPNPRVLPRLRQNLADLGAGEDAATVLQAAICATDGEQEFQMPEERYFKQKGMTEAARRDLEGRMSMVHRSAKDAGVPNEYVEKVPVQCYTASSLLERIGVKGSDLDVVFVDIAGDEITAVHRMLMVADFRPALLVFAWTGVYDMIVLEQLQWGTDETFNSFMKPTMTQLAAAGYTLYQNGGDIWAVLQRS